MTPTPAHPGRGTPSRRVALALATLVVCLVAAAPALAHFVQISINAPGGYVIVHPQVNTGVWTVQAIQGSRHPYSARSVNSGGAVTASVGPFSDDAYHVFLPATQQQRCSVDNQAGGGNGLYQCSD